MSLSLVADTPDLFAYAALDRATEVSVRAEADVIKARLRRTAEDVIEIGLALKRVKAALPHGMFLPWLAAEFDMSEPSALRFMRVAERFAGKSVIVTDMAPSALYALAAPSTSDEIVAAVEAKVASGELVTAAEVKRLRDEAREARERADSAAASVESAEGRLRMAATTAAETEARIRQEAKDAAAAEVGRLKSLLDEANNAAASLERRRAEAEARFKDLDASTDKVADEAASAERDRLNREHAAERKTLKAAIENLRRELALADKRALDAASVPPTPANDGTTVFPGPVIDADEPSDADDIANMADPRVAANNVYGALSMIGEMKLTGRQFWAAHGRDHPGLMEQVAHLQAILSDIAKEFYNV